MSDEESFPEGAVVAGVDGSEKDLRVLDWAAEEAGRRGAGLHVLSAVPLFTGTTYYDVMPTQELQDSARRIARAGAEHVRAAHPGLEVTSQVLRMDPASALVHASERASVVVVGARGLGRIAGRILGSVSQKVAAHAHSPVVMVRDLAPAPDGPVVVGVDPDHVSPEVMRFAFAQAQQRGAGVRIVHGGARPQFRPELQDPRIDVLLDSVAENRATEVQRTAEEWSERYPGVPVDVRVVPRHPVEALAEAAATASLLVVGSRTRGGLANVRLGSVSRGVLHEAPVVAVVRVGHEPGRTT
ncbi:universal stress protein [Georgenia daeguensis]|uniref:Universal stress protein n=1 Tax=Georgenia daeguensis TaxID=908355 RepID=A0ABP8EY32_9MICO